ncbi:ABC transporter substrate-binding protein [Phyllobacterium phragmitis]|uniref:ABC transporter substrate-binding protein n=1 Tax=Phyllobacterium phragmitis TaxID=2670329 RepID=A0A2S9IJU9_9HYPH|nr:extracellular solute-binding protein [Phyllobacterium phragmitis]PRD40788.1 ABC transporter substrate-binding protein [Phyllobacterium phragmitis]
MTEFTRRDFIGVAAATTLLPRVSYAQSSQVIVGTWGGDYGDLLREGVDQAIMVPQGIEVLQDVSGPVPRRTKLMAERQNRRGSMDVACLADFDMFTATELGALEELDEQNVPRMGNVFPFLRKSHSIPQIYSAHTIVYNTDRITTPPKSIHDLWDPKYRGKVGLSDFLFTTNTAFAAIAGGGSMTDFAPAKKKLMEWRSLDAKVLASTEAVAAAFKSEEIWMTIIAAARGYMWNEAGIPLGHVIAEEGAFPTVYEAAVPRNARNKENGLKYLDAMLEPAAQTAFAAKMGYVPTVSDAILDPELDKRINFTEAEKERFWRPDFAYLAKYQAEMLDFWNRDFKG